MVGSKLHGHSETKIRNSFQYKLARGARYQNWSRVEVLLLMVKLFHSSRSKKLIENATHETTIYTRTRARRNLRKGAKTSSLERSFYELCLIPSAFAII